MGLKKPSGNMYPFIDAIYNPVKGHCLFQCPYCYVDRIFKRYGKKQKPMGIDESELRANLGKGNSIFICSGCDLFHPENPDVWIRRVIDHTRKFDNRYLWHTKNPQRFLNYTESFKRNDTLCATIETNFHIPDKMGNAPSPEERADAMAVIGDYQKMITIEPIMQFDLKKFSYMVLCAQPAQVNIGADSGNNGLPEPTAKDIKSLIRVLERHTKVVTKDNLNRIMKE
jgi:DNA repair photolyase